MTRPLTDAELDHLLRFVGYGSLNGDVWFLGMEEGGGGEDELRTRLSFEAVEDLAAANTKLGADKYHLGRRVIQPTWRGMCYIMLALDGHSPTRENIRKYQATRLGRHNGSTLLAELMPIPKPKVAVWEYLELIPQYANVNDYIQRVKPLRIEYLRGLFEEHRPGVIIGYGRGFWNDFTQLFVGTPFSMEGQFLVGETGTSVIVLTDHFTARTMNGKWDAVVDLVRRMRG